MKALQDIVVLDLTRVLAGPYCTMMLADFGADVIKIEIPVKGDDTRGMGPFVNGSSLYYANVNRNKKSVTLNLKEPKGKEMFLALVKKADVVVENYRPGVMDRMGLGYEVLQEANERIIYAAVSGFGSYGRCSARPGYDIIAQAYGGLMSITGEPDGEPLRVGTAIGDVLGGMNLTIGILTALHARELSGKGQRVDVALVDSVVSSLETGTQRYFASGKLPRRIGNRYASAYPYDSFKAKDGNFVIGCGNDKLFNLLCTKVLHREDLLTDPRFLSNAQRCENHAALKVEVEKWSTTLTKEEAYEAINAAGVPTSPINDLYQVSHDPHIVEDREMFIPVKHPVIGDMRVNGNPVKLLDMMPEVRTCAPALGQHNEEIYGQLLGMDKAQLEALEEDHVI
ncbi:CaiB/BaiF CoA transferase family protein [Dysosmobacter sp.]|jgi:crotonobetainyl-CoA:carnitine CoA-transferase CaiB-like acyl-CoA transferase|uniref:CaiB/BaiF CoA transferase family protein n=1 Tax=Dysosmobacter sp. TaxID=2591382 RepID=UPI003A94120E